MWWLIGTAAYVLFILAVARFCAMNGPDEAAPGPRDDD